MLNPEHNRHTQPSSSESTDSHSKQQSSCFRARLKLIGLFLVTTDIWNPSLRTIATRCGSKLFSTPTISLYPHPIPIDKWPINQGTFAIPTLSMRDIELVLLHPKAERYFRMPSHFSFSSLLSVSTSEHRKRDNMGDNNFGFCVDKNRI